MKYIAILLIIPSLVNAQGLEFQFQPKAFPVQVYDFPPYCPWSGGISLSTPEICDIDADGDGDSFEGDYFGAVRFFENIGNAFAADFNFITGQFAGVDLDNLLFYGRTTPEFCDLDGDGDFDLFSGDGIGKIHYWQNIGSAQNASFVWITDSLDNIDISGQNTLAFADLDADGDFDLLMGAYAGTLWFYRNDGTASAWNLVYDPTAFSGIDVGSNSSPAFCDIDADGDLDLFIGNYAGNLWLYRNDGDSAQYNYTFASNNYLNQSVGQYASPEFADLDGDGDYDLLVGREPGSGNLMGDVFYYENIGTPQAAQFQLVTRNCLTLDVGWNGAKVQMQDLDADGDADLIIGNDDSLIYFENVGDSTQPEFQFITASFQSLNRSAIKPCFGDLDADGDYDLLAGEGVIPGPPTIALYTNRGTPTNPQLVLSNPDFITNPDFFVNACPGLADIDADGDWDLIVTDDNGHFFYYQNNGNPSVPNFTLISPQWQGIQFYYPECGWRGFSFGDLDDDGDLDLVMESLYFDVDSANVRLYRNAGTPTSPNMIMETNLLLPNYTIWKANPFLIDIDGDSDLDLFCGDGDAGVVFFRNITGEVSAPPPVQRHPRAGLQISLGPNPANPFVAASFELRVASNMSLDVYDLLGRRVAELASGFHLPGEYRYVWDATGRAAGVYLIRLQTPEALQSEKVILLK